MLSEGPETSPPGHSSVTQTAPMTAPDGEDLPSVPGYALLGEVGRGGMGVVYRATQLNLGRTVALKVVRGGVLAGPEERGRFRVEAEAVARLQHPNIVQVFEAGEYQGLPFFSLEYADGGSLDLRLRDHPLGVAEAARLTELLARAVHYAHESGILHRDLKPANILLTADGTPKLTDFGLAKLRDLPAEQTASGAVLGTPSYMAPEQAWGQSRLRPVGPWTDVWALGAILYELLTGRPPFRGATRLDTLQLVLTAEPVGPRQLQPGVPRDLATICLKCLQKEPGRRYATAAELAEDLARFRAGAPVRARPVGRGERLVRWCRRNPVVATLAGLVLLALAGGTVVSSYFAWEASERADVAERREREADQARQKAAREERRARKAESDAKERADALAFQVYKSQVALAHQEWRDNGVAGAERLLDACPPALRGWEWRHVRHLCHLELFRLAPAKQNTHGLAYTPDGRRLVRALADGELQLLDAASGRLLRSVRLPVGPSPSAVWTYDYNTYRHPLAISPDGRTVACAGRARTVYLRDTETLGEVGTLVDPTDRFPRLLSLAWSGDGKWLATCGGEGGIVESYRVRIWDVASRRVRHTLRGHTNQVTAVAFDRQGRRLASSSVDKTVRLWDVAAGQLERVLTGHAGVVYDLAFHPGGKTLASADADGSVRLWDPATGKALERLEGHSAPVAVLAFHPDGHTLASGSHDTNIKVWDLARARERFTLRGHTRPVRGLAFSPDGKRLASGGLDTQGFVWDATRDRQVLTLGGHRGLITDACFSPQGRWIAALSGFCPTRPPEVCLYRAATGERERVLGLQSPHIDFLRINALAFSPDEKWLVTGGGHQALGEVAIWDPATGECVRRLWAHRVPVTGVAFHPAGRLLATAGDDGVVKLLDFPSGREVRSWRAHARTAFTVAFSPDGKRLATSGGEGKSYSARVWDCETGQLLHTFPRPGIWTMYHGLAFSRDGRLLAMTNWESVAVYEVATGRLVAQLKGHARGMMAVAFSPDGERLITGGMDRLITMWDVRRGKEVFTLRGQCGTIVVLGFSPDGRRLVAGFEDHTVKVWDAFPAP